MDIIFKWHFINNNMPFVNFVENLCTYTDTEHKRKRTLLYDVAAQVAAIFNYLTTHAHTHTHSFMRMTLNCL